MFLKRPFVPEHLVKANRVRIMLVLEHIVTDTTGFLPAVPRVPAYPGGELKQMLVPDLDYIQDDIHKEAILAVIILHS
jgi:hypothetical protein